MILSSCSARSRLIAGLALVAMCGCAGPNVVERNAAGFAPWVADTAGYALRPGDEIEVKLPFTPELSDKVIIDPSGNVALPLIGTVHTADQTIEHLAADLKRRYSQHLRDPEVDVVQRGFASQKIFVGGEVTKPGLIDLPGRIGALEAITMAGGLLDTAESKQIAVIRRAADGRPMLKVVDFTGYVAPGDGQADVPLRSLDVVFVPKSSIAEVDLFISQYVTKALPFDRGTSYSFSPTSR